MIHVEEPFVESSSRLSFRSYFALIPVFRRRKKGVAERNVIKLIHKSNICKSSPVLKTLLIENVRICCVVMESSGKQSVKILYASVPILIALISKANPKFENLLKNENVSSCLKILKESDFESVLNNVYHATIIIHSGIKKFYPTIFVNMLKDSLLISEKSLLHLFKFLLHMLKSLTDFLYDNFAPVFHYLSRQSLTFRTFALYVTDNFHVLMTDMIKYSIFLTSIVQKAAIAAFYAFRKILQHFNGILAHCYKNSALRDFLMKLGLFLKLSAVSLRSSNGYGHIEQRLMQLFHISKPYIWIYFQKLFENLKTLILKLMPILKHNIKYAVIESIPLLRKFLEENFESIVSGLNSIKCFLLENRHHFKSFCCHACNFLYSLASYVYNGLQIILPQIIKFSSHAMIYLIACLTFALEKCLLFCHIHSKNIFRIIKIQKKLFFYLSETAVKFLKTIYRIALEIQPYIVPTFRIAFHELIQLIHMLSPTLWACMCEVKSSTFYASKELVAKSCFAVKRIMPSFYCALKTAVPPTVLATNEIIKSSRDCVLIVYPAVFKGVLTVRPEVKECLVILISDGNQAFLEVVTVSYSASCHLKDAARSVCTNLPIVYKAAYEVFKTTTCAAIEVSTTSINAKSRMVEDFKKARELVSISFMLAEQELAEAYTDFVFEINSIMPTSQGDALTHKYPFHYISNCFVKFCNNSLDKMTMLLENSAVYSRHIFKALVNASDYLFFFLYTICISTFNLEEYKTKDLQQYLFKLFFSIFTNISYITSLFIQHYYEYACSKTKSICSMFASNISISSSKAWDMFKSNVHATWIEICQISPKIWTKIEHFATSFWNFLVEHVPGVWIALKAVCFEIWELIVHFVPHIWHYLSTTTPVLWSYGRHATKFFWGIFINISSLTWQHAASLSSDYWMMGQTYFPLVWFAGCDETKRGWNATCYLIENCWNFTVETCFLSWKFLHRSVAKSWRRSIVFTKTAYCIFTTTGSVLQKSFCVCYKSKNYAYVIFEAAPDISNFTSNALQLSKLSNALRIFGKRKQTVYHNSGTTSDTSSSEQKSYEFNIKKCIFSVVNSLNCTEKLLNYEKLIPSKLFGKYWSKVAFI